MTERLQAVEAEVKQLIETYSGLEEAGRMAAEIVAIFVAYLVELDTPDGKHVAVFTDRDFTMKHPLACRPFLFECDVNRELGTWPGPPGRPGEYLVYREDDGLLVAERRDA